MKKISYLLLLLAVACGSSKDETDRTLADPSGLRIEAASDHLSGTLFWTDNASNESGYYVFLVEGDRAAGEPTATLPAGSTSYSYDGLQYDSSYRFGVQAFGKNYAMSRLIWYPNVYTTPTVCPIDPPEPEDPNPIDPITFHWMEVTAPAGVSIYETTDPLSGRANHAWYAVADPKLVDVRVLYPGNGVTKTIDQQAEDAGDCLVLVNGGIFSAKYLLPIGFALADGVQTPWRVVEEDGLRIDREYWSADGKLHPVSRAMFGVDKSGTPGVYWSFTPEHGSVFVYDEPIPSTAGETPCPPASATYPCIPASWIPYNALTCGPVLLHDGRCPINDKKTTKGYWETNYELWADDIYGVSQRADRTAVGYTADGKVILCIVDGRIDSAKGATTLEMASVMKGLGCIGAINLDGGGSTGMWAGGQHLNDLTGGNRPVMTTVGFFQKK